MSGITRTQPILPLISENHVPHQNSTHDSSQQISEQTKDTVTELRKTPSILWPFARQPDSTDEERRTCIPTFKKVVKDPATPRRANVPDKSTENHTTPNKVNTSSNNTVTETKKKHNSYWSIPRKPLATDEKKHSHIPTFKKVVKEPATPSRVNPQDKSAENHTTPNKVNASSNNAVTETKERYNSWRPPFRKPFATDEKKHSHTPDSKEIVEDPATPSRVNTPDKATENHTNPNKVNTSSNNTVTETKKRRSFYWGSPRNPFATDEKKHSYIPNSKEIVEDPATPSRLNPQEKSAENHTNPNGANTPDTQPLPNTHDSFIAPPQTLEALIAQLIISNINMTASNIRMGAQLDLLDRKITLQGRRINNIINMSWCDKFGLLFGGDAREIFNRGLTDDDIRLLNLPTTNE